MHAFNRKCENILGTLPTIQNTHKYLAFLQQHYLCCWIKGFVATIGHYLRLGRNHSDREFLFPSEQGEGV